LLGRGLILLVLAGSLAGCATTAAHRTAEGEPAALPPTAFSHHAASPQVELYWSCARPATGVLALEGVAYNPFPAPVRYLEVETVGLDATGQVVSWVRGATRAYTLGSNQTSPFRLDLTLAGNEARLELRFRPGQLRVAHNGVLVRPLFASPEAEWTVAQAGCAP
jgi:hypothetical protein